MASLAKVPICSKKYNGIPVDLYLNSSSNIVANFKMKGRILTIERVRGLANSVLKGLSNNYLASALSAYEISKMSVENGKYYIDMKLPKIEAN